MHIFETSVAQLAAMAITLAGFSTAAVASTSNRTGPHASLAVTAEETSAGDQFLSAGEAASASSGVHRGRARHRSDESPTVPGGGAQTSSSTGSLRLAQADPPAPAVSAVSAAAGPQGTDQTTLQQVVVTGTRIHRANLELATPITQVGSDILQSNAPANVADTLNTLPQLAVGLTPKAGTVGTSGGTNGINALNLLNLGPERTLVLLDGRRMTGFNSTGIVDINTIPQQLIQRVDVVTGGGSADYGSDAVAGVVNFILNTHFTGFKYEAQWGESIYGDGKNGQLAATYGTSLFGGRGHFIISGQYSNQGLVGDSNTRPWFDSTKLVANPLPGGSPAEILASNVNLSLASPGGIIINSPVNGALAGTQFGRGGVPEIFQFGPQTGTGGLMFGGTKNDLAGLIPIQSAVDTRDIFSRFSFDVTPNTTLYTELTFAESHDVDPSSYNFELGTVSIASGNPYLPPAVQSEMTALGLPRIQIGTWNQDIGPIHPVDNYKDYHVVIGIDAKLPGTWTLRGYYQYGRVDGVNSDQNEVIKANYTQAVDAVRSPGTGEIVCANPADGCVPLDVLGTGVATQEALSFVEGTGWRKNTEQEHDASITVQGDPLSTWAGPVSLAFGPEVRREEATADVDPLSASSGWFSGNFKPTIGAYDVEEFFAEAYVPLARNLPFAQSLDVDMAARATNYSTTGYVTTWKFGSTWRPIHDVMLRASTSRDIRAPNISDLYAISAFTQTVTDPEHGGVSDTITLLSGANPDLKPEIARNYSYGIVFTPSSVPGFHASADYYKVDITGFVSSLVSNAQQAVNDCYEGLTQICSLVTRNGAGAITQVVLGGINAGYLSTEGVNFDASYNTDLSHLYSPLGILGIRVMGTRLQKYFLFTGLTGFEYAGEVSGNNSVATGGTYFPRWKLEMPMIYTQGPVTLGLTGRYIGSGTIVNGAPANYISDNHVSGVFYLDGSMAYRISRGLEVYAAADNIFNKYPPASGTVSALAFLSQGTAAGLYDLTGTTFRVGIRGTF